MTLFRTASELRMKAPSLRGTKYENECFTIAAEMERATTNFSYKPDEDALRELTSLNCRARYLIALDPNKAA